MYITWLGHSAFKIQTKEEVTLVTDPYEPSIGLKLPRGLKAHIVTLSHSHYDHANQQALLGHPFIIDGPGEYEIQNVLIYGLASWHDKKEGAERGANTIYRIEAEGISLAHLGDLGHILTNGQLAELKNIDILMLPVGDVYTIGAKEAAQVVSQLEPRIVIPMHYKVPNLKINIETAQKFCKEMGVSCNPQTQKLKVTRKDLPQEEMKVIVLEKS